MKTKLIKYLVPAVILLGLFYWFQIRPVTIRSSCANIAIEASSSEDKKTFLKSKYDGYYEMCLQRKGLK